MPTFDYDDVEVEMKYYLQSNWVKSYTKKNEARLDLFVKDRQQILKIWEYYVEELCNKKNWPQTSRVLNILFNLYGERLLKEPLEGMGG